MVDYPSKNKTSEVSFGPADLVERARELLRQAIAALDADVGDEESIRRAGALASQAGGMLDDSTRMRAEERATKRFVKQEE